ncbi:hypothetical protein CBR_g37827 [Chara braunii]|uniref:Myb-like domain-containing protein n=1 Tax=Chara braunii TaxID=69332 RepID=A0A388LP01_CHABU|nr:hypothetical protein CBR_g37827 [Chara braunii]|eukprot:GBG83955.1 hypothetical protein CBR_g37827 [Chara braunii]
MSMAPIGRGTVVPSVISSAPLYCCPLSCSKAASSVPCTYRDEHMADMLRKTTLIIFLVGALLLVIILHLWQVVGTFNRVGRRRGSKKLRQAASVKTGMGDGYGRGAEGYGIGRGGYAVGGGAEQSVHHRFDPNLYSHLPPHQQPLPYDITWAPPSSTLDLAWGSTQTSYDTPARVDERRGGLGPMSTLLADMREGRSLPVDLQLSPSTTMDVSRTVVINDNGQGCGSTSQTMQDAGFDDGISHLRSNRVPTSVASEPQPVPTPVHRPSSTAPYVQAGSCDVSTGGGSPRCVERIICRFNNMRATSDDDGARQGGAATETEPVDVDVGDDDDEYDDGEEVVVKEATAGRKKQQASKGRGKGKSTGKDGGTNGDGGDSGGRANWNLNESLVLVRCKRDQEDYFANAGHNFARMKTKDQKWADIAKRMDKEGVRRDGEQCMKRELRHRTCVGVRTRATMDIQVALRGRVLGRTTTCYEMRHRRGEDDDSVYNFVKPTTIREVRQYEVDADGETVLYASLCLGFEDDLLCEAVGHVAKVSRAIPNRWDGGVDVLADIIDLLICNLADEYGDHMTDHPDFRVHPDPPLHDRPGLRGDIRKFDD